MENTQEILTQDISTQNIFVQEILENVISILDSKKAVDICSFDMRGKEYICDFVVIASALASKHATSLLNYLKEELKPKGVVFYAVDDESEEWIVIDLGEIMIHIFTENYRKKYNLEEFLSKTFLDS